jgi:glucose-6-phosphate isomerase
MKFFSSFATPPIFNIFKKGLFMTSVKEFATKICDFPHYDSTRKLKKLALNPFDLTQENHLTSERMAKFSAESCGYKLLYATERVDDSTMQALQQLAEESGALKKMENMQSGEISNFIQGFSSDNRPVLHTALRDFFDNAHPAKVASEAAQLAKNEINRLKSFIEKNDRNNTFKHLYIIGVGGSDLGPLAHYFALKHLQKPDRKLHFISNIDPDNVALAFKHADLKTSLVLINSKSGTTLETSTNEAFVRNKFKQAGIKPKDHFISVSCHGTPLDNPNEYLECFHIWDWVGGRFATSSLAGGFVLAFAYGFDVYWEFLRGANSMDKAALNSDLNQNLPLLGALIGVWNRNFLKHPILAIVPYSQALGRYTAHLQQLDMESNGKRIDQNGQFVDFETGPIIFGEPGTSAQHSFFQLIHQGSTIVPVEFIGYRYNQTNEDFNSQDTTSQEKLNANLIAQALALATGRNHSNPNKVFPGNRPSHILFSKRLTPYSLGSLLSYYEHKIAFQGFIWGINSFDQEGVQLGKELAKDVIERISCQKSTKDQSKQANRTFIDTYLKILQSL